MAISDLDTLADNMPELFEWESAWDKWDDDYVFVPIDSPDNPEPEIHLECNSDSAKNANTLLGDDALPDIGRIAVPVPGRLTFPFGVRPPDWSGFVPPPDFMAFYIPFHRSIRWFGIYIIRESAELLKNFLIEKCKAALTNDQAWIVTRIFLYGHEIFHHRVECFATRLELTHRKRIFLNAFSGEYTRSFGTDDCLEEALANASGYRRVKKHFVVRSKRLKGAVLAALAEYIKCCPPGYRRGLDYIGDDEFNAGLRNFAERNQNIAFPHLKAVDANTWLCFPHAFDGIANVASKVSWMIAKNSELAKRHVAHVRYLSYRQLAEKLQRYANCVLVRQAKGSHEMWSNPQGKPFVVPRHARDLSDGTIRQIIRDAGVNMSLTEFKAS